METNVNSQTTKARGLCAVWLRCARCFGELTQHGRMPSGAYRCQRCGRERGMRAGRYGY